MITQNSRKILALAASTVMVSASIVATAIPASAAAGDLTIKPTTGVEYSVFNDDIFALTAVPNEATVSSDASLAYKISNPDKYSVVVDFENTAINGADTASIMGYKPSGETVNVFSGALAFNADDTAVAADRSDDTHKTGRILIDFADAGITSAVISGMGFTGDLTPTFEVFNGDTGTVDSSDNLTSTAYDSLVSADRMGLNDGNASISVQAWLDVDSVPSTVDAAYASEIQAINWYDPANVSIISKVSRMTATGRTFGGDIQTATNSTSRQDFLMADSGSNSNAIAATMKFNVPMSFAQIDLADIKINTIVNGTAGTSTVMNPITGTAALDGAGDIEELTASNGKSADKNGELAFRVWADHLFEASDKLQVSFQHSDTDASSNAAPVYNSPSFTVATQTASATAVTGTVSVAPTAGTAFTTSTATLRAGEKSVTYTVQAQTSGNAADLDVANIPFVARVEAGDFLASNETLTVSGVTSVIDQANEAVFVTGLTDSDGKFTVTVAAAQAALGTTYNVQFWIANGASEGVLTGITEQTATYGSTNAAAFAAGSAVNSSAAPTVTFSVTDAFGGAVSTTSTDKVYSVEIKAPDTDNLKAYGQVVDGSVSFAFTNWLSAGESDVLTARLYTGTSTSPLSTDYTAFSTNVTLYAPVAASAISLTAATINDVVVEYNDFIEGKKTTLVGPTSGTNGTDITGSVVDANGAGIPGAPVTLSAAGMQFLSGTTFSIGSVELVTDAAGTFTAEVWTHTKSATGVVVTATNGANTDTVKLISDLPSGSNALDRGNLEFSVDMPANVVVNTTYAFTALVQDVWGNPVDNASVKFDGFGSAQFNGKATETRDTNRHGEATVYLRSLKDVDGLSALEVSVTAVDHDSDDTNDTGTIATPIATDVTTTSWDESSWSNLYQTEVNFLESASAIPSSQKVNAGSFKGYVALYAKGYEGQRMSAKVGNDWVVVADIPAATNDLFRAVEFVGAGVEISVRLYIDRVLIDTIPLLTK